MVNSKKPGFENSFCKELKHSFRGFMQSQCSHVFGKQQTKNKKPDLLRFHFILKHIQ